MLGLVYATSVCESKWVIKHLLGDKTIERNQNIDAFILAVLQSFSLCVDLLGLFNDIQNIWITFTPIQSIRHTIIDKH